MKGEISQKYSYLFQKEEQIIKKYEREAFPYVLEKDKLKSMHQEIICRQAELIAISQSQPKNISKYFVRYRPLSFNLAEFGDGKKFGGPKMAFNQGKIYIGTIVDGKRHGQGVIVSPKGKIYEGQMFSNERQGLGVQIYERGNFYVGGFQQNKREGKGLMVWANEEQKDENLKYQYYNGAWKDGEPNWLGFHSSNNISYYGSFKAGVKHGKAIELTPSSKFEGSFINGHKEGNGFFISPQHYLYEGAYKEGVRHGYGRWLSLTSFEEYQGFYLKDKRQGVGLYQKTDQFYYRGMFTEDKPNGNGEYVKLGYKTESKSCEKALKTEIGCKNDFKRKSEQLRKANSQTGNKEGSVLTSKQQILFRSNVSRQKGQFSQRKSLSSAKVLPRAPEMVPLDPQSHKCRKKGCSCNKWCIISSKKTSIDEPKLKRLFSSRKILVKQLIK